MKIKKLAHCCLLIDVKDRRILLDPGSYSIEQHDKLSDVDIILITHEHFDHLHVPSLKELVKRIPDVSVIANDAVGEIIAKEGIKHHVMKHGDSITIKDIEIETFGKDHATIYKTLPAVSNVGYFIENQFFFPGDAFTDPGKKIDILALPVVGPWLKISEAVDYALQLKPRVAIPVHDQMRIPAQHALPEKILGENGIKFIKLEEGGEVEF